MTAGSAASFQWRKEGGGEGVASRCLEFLDRVGIEYGILDGREAQLLEGLAILDGKLLIDPHTPVWPGDLLHEAGHIAVSAPEERARLGPIVPDGGDELATIAWSYAAALACDVSPNCLFHEGGYRGDSETLRTAFASGSYIGAPMLGSFGMTDPHGFEADHPFPTMIRWLR